MIELDEHNALEYLRRAGWIGHREQVTIQPLSGGVSGQVLYVARPEHPGADFVLKQARPQLRTPLPWFSSVERIWREVEVLRICQGLLARPASPQVLGGPQHSVLEPLTPRVLFEDRAQFVFAMSAAPPNHHVWKQDLLAGIVQPEIAAACGTLLGRLHAGAWGDETVRRRIGDQTLFDQLRIDPYYRALARAFPSYAARIERLIASVRDNPMTLVHADFTPKNLLVFEGGLMMVDFETGHWGDPAFDLGLFLAHLVLKAAHRAPDHARYLDLTRRFWQTYEGLLVPAVGQGEYAALVARAIQNFAGCAWARLDGVSQIDYLHDEPRRDMLRGLCQDLLGNEVATWEEVLTEFHCRRAARGA